MTTERPAWNVRSLLQRAKAREEFRHDPSPIRRAAVRMAENGHGVAKLVEFGVSRADARLLVLGD